MTLAVTGAQIHTSPGRTRYGDLHVTDGVVAAGVATGPATVIEATGCSVVPLLVESVYAGDPPPPADGFDLVPGRPATFAVVRGAVSVSAIRTMLVVGPADLIAVVVHGTVVAWHGRPVRTAGTDDVAEDDPRLGAWTDHRRDMTQYLTADGRYSETRGGRRDAYTGTFWLDEDRITYLDDTGFWAFGQYHHGVLHHAGYVLAR